jgi:hypothetical protein
MHLLTKGKYLLPRVSFNIDKRKILFTFHKSIFFLEFENIIIIRDL